MTARTAGVVLLVAGLLFFALGLVLVGLER